MAGQHTMRRTRICFLVTFLILAIGGLSFCGWYLIKWYSVPSVREIPAAKTEPTNTLSATGEGISDDGYATSFSYEDYSDGTSIRQWSVFYHSPRRANAEY